MTTAGWAFMTVCWAVLIVVTVWCYRLILRQK